jgi:hypothetical protein
MPHPKPTHPKTAQLVLDKNNELLWVAYCQAHGRKSSNLQGVDEHGLLFRCSAGPTWMSHLFHAKKGAKTPSTVDEIEAWKQQQLERKAVAIGRGQLQ